MTSCGEMQCAKCVPQSTWLPHRETAPRCFPVHPVPRLSPLSCLPPTPVIVDVRPRGQPPGGRVGLRPKGFEVGPTELPDDFWSGPEAGGRLHPKGGCAHQGAGTRLQDPPCDPALNRWLEKAGHQKVRHGSASLLQPRLPAHGLHCNRCTTVPPCPSTHLFLPPGSITVICVHHPPTLHREGGTFPGWGKYRVLHSVSPQTRSSHPGRGLLRTTPVAKGLGSCLGG